MNKTIVEDWEFIITVTSAKPCRMGYEVGDTFYCKYECPSGFCPKTMAVLHSYCEVARGGGDYQLLGGNAKNEINFGCADGTVQFNLVAKKINL
ncbi:TIGR04076 family protein [Anaerocolumna sp. MB42-C2]|uniref:TIGR04076 family protein n=1 Tax=Anaerocolumna sp. MB42-C2 TaxID=3070997 RepID=UPI0027E1C5EC|nr:TIGR04076 family protein [Anaerocolumna sp. MB42-C2]WMJ87425.1 TIGR04076 family protein [Anaerocolumna sp. MB42-C2]